MPPDEEKNLRVFLTDKISVIDLTSAIKKETIDLRRTARLKLPDCIIAATAITLNAILLTCDTRLLRLEWSGFIVKNIKKN